jgi:hypothetical protein
MFDLDQFVADCRDACAVDKSHKLVREVLCRAGADPSGVLKALGEPTRGAIKTLYRSDDLAILNVVWAPYMILTPHNHNMWAVIGIYTGREDNIFWRRVPGGHAHLEAAGAKALTTGGNAPRNLFALLKSQRYQSPPAWRWSNPSIASQDPIDAALVPPLKRSGDVPRVRTTHLQAI